MLKLFRSKIYLALTLMLLVLLFGLFGYRYVAGFNWSESLYMTIITVTTVGFQEVRPLDTEARLFTVILIVSSVFIFAFAISVITEYILGRNSLQILKKKKVKQRIDALERHVIICGYGRNGSQAAQRLQNYKQPFVVVERDPTIIEKYETDDILFQEGDANEDEVLQEAGVERARYLITFMDQLSMEGEHTTNLEEVGIEDFRNQVECNTLRDLDLRRKTGCTIIGYIEPDGNYIINPEADLPLQPKSKVIVLGRPEQIRKLNEMFHIG